MKKIVISLSLLWFLNSYSQSPRDIEFIKSQSNTTVLKSLKEQFQNQFLADSLAIEDYVRMNDVKKRYVSEGVTYEIYKIIDGKPIYRSTDNLSAAKATKTNAIQAGGELGLNLSGDGMYIGVWDGGSVLKTHVEFQNNGTSRITTPDMPLPNPPSDGHGTHVAGTIGAAGIDPEAKGMAPLASILSYNWTNDEAEVVSAINNNGLLLSNHSYGVSPFNDEGQLAVPIWLMGNYSSQAASWDQIAYNAPYYLMVASAGNAGGESYTGGTKDGFDKLTHEKNAKNNLVVANANPFVNAGGFLINVVINSSSSQGPSDDGRIKPDIAGDGTQLKSTYNTNSTAYATLSGTSMASPNVSGSLLLLQEYYHQLFNVYMRSATLKGLVCHTAVDAGLVGPDAKFGWGLLDAKESATVITNSQVNNPTSHLSERTLNQDQTYTVQVVVNDPKKLKATICWTDVPGTPKDNQVNSPTPALVNDLDLRIIKNGEVNYPWKLQLSDVSLPAIKGDNTVDNVEKVEVDNASGTYTIEISHKGTLTGGPQNYSLIISGFDAITLSNKTFTLENIKVYPNPANDVLNFETADGITLDKVEVFDTIGKRVLSTTVVNSSIDISQLNSGIYFVKIYSGDQQLTKKIIKK